MKIDSFLLGTAAIVTTIGIGVGIFAAFSLEIQHGSVSFSFSSSNLIWASLLSIGLFLPCCLGVGCILMVWVGLMERKINAFQNIRCDNAYEDKRI
jgi:hypothetical protein